jgi:fructokinase
LPIAALSGKVGIVIVCWGELLWDLFPDAPRLGGAAANVAYHCAMLGERVCLVSRAGDDALGRRAVAELGAAGVDTELVQVDAAAPTGTVHVEVRNGEPRFSIGEQAAWDRIECDERVAAALAAADIVVFGTLAQRTSVAQGALQQALKVAPRAVRVCDLNLRPPFSSRAAVEATLGAAHVVKLNETEAEALGAMFGVSDPMRWLLDEQGIELVALTRGARGCLLATRAHRAEHGGFDVPAEAGDRVGAGDAFTAVLSTLLVRRDVRQLDSAALDSLAALANRYAAIVASQPGAMPRVPEALRSEIHERLRG